jgi:hypothetical protein
MRRSWPALLLVVACSTEPAPASTPAALPSAAALSASVSIVPPPPPAPSAACAESPEITLFSSPRAPRADAALQILAVAEKPLDTTLLVRAPDGTALYTSSERHGGPPYWWSVELSAPPAGAYRAELTGSQGACKEITVEADPAPDKSRTWSAVWGVHADWTAATERLYSAWIEKLFDAPLDEQPTWPALHEVLRDKKRNLLHDYLGQGEDDAGPHALVIDPDCADLPYFLRAYFAFKLSLPFGFSACSRGGGGQPPRCQRWHSNLEARPDHAGRHRPHRHRPGAGR